MAKRQRAAKQKPPKPPARLPADVKEALRVAGAYWARKRWAGMSKDERAEAGRKRVAGRRWRPVKSKPTDPASVDPAPSSPAPPVPPAPPVAPPTPRKRRRA